MAGTEKRTPLRRVIASSLVGTTIECNDSSSTLGRRIGFQQDIFPSYDPVGTMLAFATYAVGFVARPWAGSSSVISADRIGRKKLLMLSLMLMASRRC